jgi:release factor glutamine methyltransferase
LAETLAPATVREALVGATGVLVEAKVDTPRLDAELLLAEALGVDRAQLVLDADSTIEGHVAERFAGLIRRRAAREPVAYILGRKEFRHITLSVDRRVLIPRPETELLVEAALRVPAGARVVDVGTGSGAVALALKHERPDLVVTGTDASEEALTVAQENAARLGLEVSFVQADLMTGVAGPLDAILANLPYVPEGTELQPEIARYEPGDALYAGPDGLDLIRQLVEQRPGVRFLALEVGVGQATAVLELLRRAGFMTTQVLRDLASHERVVLGQK